MYSRLAAVLAALSLCAAGAFGAPTFVVDDLTSTPTVLDRVVVDALVTTPGEDLSGLPNNVLITGFTPGWNITFGAGSYSGSPDNFLLALNSTTASASSAGQLVLAWVVDPAVAALTAPVINLSANASLTGGSIQYFLESATGPVALPTAGAAGSGLDAAGGWLLSPLAMSDGINPAWPNPVSPPAPPISILAPTSPYSLALIAVLTATGAGQTFNFDFTVTGVPEPGFYGLLALLLSGLYFVSMRKRSLARDTNNG